MEGMLYKKSPSMTSLTDVMLKTVAGFFFVVGCKSGRIVFVSDAIQQVLGKSQTDWCATDLYSNLHPEDADKVRQHLRYGGKESGRAKRNFVCRMKAGNLLDSQDYAEINCIGYIQRWHTDESKKNDALLCEVKQADDEDPNHECYFVATGRLRSSSLDYNDHPVMHHSGDEFVSHHSADGQFLFVDPRVEAVLGYDPLDLFGLSYYDFIHPDDRERIHDCFNGVLESGDDVCPTTFRIRTKRGNYVRLNTSASAVYDPTGAQMKYTILTNSIDELGFAKDDDDTVSQSKYDVITPGSHLGHDDTGEGRSLSSLSHHMMQHMAEHVTELVNHDHDQAKVFHAQKSTFVFSKMHKCLFVLFKIAKKLRL